MYLFIWRFFGYSFKNHIHKNIMCQQFKAEKLLKNKLGSDEQGQVEHANQSRLAPLSEISEFPVPDSWMSWFSFLPLVLYWEYWLTDWRWMWLLSLSPVLWLSTSSLCICVWERLLLLILLFCFNFHPKYVSPALLWEPKILTTVCWKINLGALKF